MYMHMEIVNNSRTCGTTYSGTKNILFYSIRLDFLGVWCVTGSDVFFSRAKVLGRERLKRDVCKSSCLLVQFCAIMIK